MTDTPDDAAQSGDTRDWAADEKAALEAEAERQAELLRKQRERE